MGEVQPLPSPPLPSPPSLPLPSPPLPSPPLPSLPLLSPPSLPLPSPPYQDLHELETQVKRLVDTIDQQSTHIGALKDELEQQREVSTDVT